MPHFWAKSLPYSLQPRRLQRPPAGFIFAKRPLPTAFWPAPNLERPNYWPFWTLMAISSRNFLYNRPIFKMRLGKFVGLGKGYQGKEFLVLSNLAIRNFLVTLILCLNAKSSLSLWSKWQIGHRKWFLNINLYLIKTFLIAKFDCIKQTQQAQNSQAKILGGSLGFFPLFITWFCDLNWKKRLNCKSYR